MAAKGINYWKWGIIAAIVLAAFYGGCRYGIKSVTKETKSDTAIKNYSIVISAIPIPVVMNEDSFVYMVHTEHDTLEVEGEKEIRWLPAETPLSVADDLNDYNRKRLYDTTVIESGDTVGIKTEVHKNRLVKQDIKVSHNDTAITNTVIKTLPKKFVVSVIASALGNSNNLLYGQGAGLQLKLPNESSYQLQVFNISGHRPMYMITKGWPVKLGQK